jgi:hypothetical protein
VALGGTVEHLGVSNELAIMTTAHCICPRSRVTVGALFLWPIAFALGCGTPAPGADLTPDSSATTDGSMSGSINADGSATADSSIPNGQGADATPVTPGTDAGGADTSTPPASDATTGTSGFGVVTNRYDNGRTGANTSETILTVANVSGGTFGLLFSRVVDGHIYAQPLYLRGLQIGGATHNVVYVATEHNTVYAFDADDPAASTPLWSKSLGPSYPLNPSPRDVQPVPAPYNVSCQDMFPEVGITSTPVIDAANGRIYVVAKTLESGTVYQRIHALDVGTGAELLGGPVAIQGSVPGTGAGSSGGMVAFDARLHLNRPGLLLNAGVVYIAFSSHCDNNPYHGWVFAYDASTLARKGIFNTTPNGTNGRGGIWQSGMGLSADDQNSVYFSAGNGDVDPSNTGALLGMSIGRLQLQAAGLTMMDWWTAPNAVTLNASDVDLQSGVMVLPNPRVLIGGGKDAKFIVLDPANMGKYVQGTSYANILQGFPLTGTHIHLPVYWNGPSGPTLYVWTESSALRAFRFNGMLINTTAVSQYTGELPTHPGGVLSLSSNGSTMGSGILWATLTSATIDTDAGIGDAWHRLVPGAMYAFDANNLAVPIWTSLANKARDDLGILAKFNAPMVANGKVYVGTNAPAGTASGTLRVYGLN